MASAATLVRAGSTTLLALLFCQSAAAAKTDDLAPSKAEARAFDSTDPAEAMRLATIAAKAGLRDAQMMLGDRYLRSEDSTKDVERAIEWLRRAAAQGSARAQSELGWIYSGGIEGKLDTAEALKWFTVAARQEDAYSLARLAEFYHRGIAVERDEPRAKRLMLRSAELGDRNSVNAAWNLLLFARTPDDRNPRLGLHFLFKGANADEPNSVYMLAREYLIGRARCNGSLAPPRTSTRSARFG
jgi:TPR repeat protein